MTLQAPLSMGIQARTQEQVACPPPADLSDPGTEPSSLTSPALTGTFLRTRATWEALTHVRC